MVRVRVRVRVRVIVRVRVRVRVRDRVWFSARDPARVAPAEARERQKHGDDRDEQRQADDDRQPEEAGEARGLPARDLLRDVLVARRVEEVEAIDVGGGEAGDGVVPG